MQITINFDEIDDCRKYKQAFGRIESILLSQCEQCENAHTKFCNADCNVNLILKTIMDTKGGK